MKSYIGITGCSGSLGKTLLKIKKKKNLFVFLLVKKSRSCFKMDYKKQS